MLKKVACPRFLRFGAITSRLARRPLARASNFGRRQVEFAYCLLFCFASITLAGEPGVSIGTTLLIEAEDRRRCPCLRWPF